MLKNFKLTIEYDGTAYHGWQRQKQDRTIQGEIEKAIMTMTGKRVALIGSGRTDAGVHALGQVANFHSDTDLMPGTFLKGLTSLLHEDIVIKACSKVHRHFHARYDAKSKTYSYRILNLSQPAAICRQYAWFIRKKLDADAMKEAIAYIVGTHDFKAFEGTGSPRSSTIRNVMDAALVCQDQGKLIFNFEANGFLRFMVRNLIGTLVEVGRGKITPSEFKRILLSMDRNLAGATAPPHGLFLMKVKY